MKYTRAIFVLRGKKELVEIVSNSVKYFKAIEFVDGKLSEERMNDIFLKNKSIVICNDIPEIYSMFPSQVIKINVTETDNNEGNNINVTGNNIVRKFMAIANKYNIDIGDHIQNNKSLISEEHECVFCMLMEGQPIHEQEYIYESENYLVIPGSGAFYNGYLMVIPKKHILSFSELNSIELEELFTVIEDIKLILSRMYNKDILFWENGSGQIESGKAKNSIVHAHGHFMPINSDYDILKEATYHGVPLEHIEVKDFNKYKDNSYLFIINPVDNNLYIKTSNEHYIPRQFVRQLLCEDLIGDNQFWDWRIYPFWNQVEDNGKEFLKYVRENFKDLPKRIQLRTAKFIS